MRMRSRIVKQSPNTQMDMRTAGTCICGHPIGHHHDAGCQGSERMRACGCRRDYMQALDYAFSLARRRRVREAA